MNKKLIMFGIPILAISLVTAVLLQYFGIITIIADVSPAIIIDGKEAVEISHIIPEEAPGGELFCFLHKVTNDASINIDLDFVTTCKESDEWVGCNGITTEVYEIPETTTVNLCKKGSNWQCIQGGASATIEFDTVNPKFSYELHALGLQSGVKYALIYYGDDDPRFSVWGGNNPGKVILTFISSVGGTYDGAGSVELNMNLPSSPDWNINPSPNYCDNNNGFDDYDHCRGAKLWIVPISDLTGGNQLPLLKWNPNAWLFEEDLITYADCDIPRYEIDPPYDVVDMVKTGPVTTLETKSKTMTPVLVCYDFDVMIKSGQYVITTKILPA